MKGIADSAGMAAEQIHLKLLNFFMGDRYVAELAETGRHTVDRKTTAKRAINHGPVCDHPITGILRQLYRRGIQGDSRQLLESQRFAVNNDCVQGLILLTGRSEPRG